VSILAALIEPVAGLIGKLIPDKDKARALAHEIATMAENQHHEAMMAQLEVNAVEAASGSLFIGGWRPAVGWVCVLGMAVNFLVVPFVPTLAPLDTTTMMPVLMGMLGLGGMRSFEKASGVARK
jgi:hypothetical protein